MIDEELLKRYLAGELSDMEMASFRRSLEEDPGVMDEILSLRRAEIEARIVSAPDRNMTGEAWKGTYKRIRRMNLLRHSVAAAACVALVAGAFFLGGRKNGLEPEYLSNDVNVETGAGQRSKVTLPDGTTVSLNECSSLSYNVVEWKKERNVSLTGQAVFEVVHMDDVPFSVNSGFFTVNDIGTSFEISGYADDDLHYVRLISGEASVDILDSETPEVLTPGLTLFLNTKTGESFVDKSSSVTDTFDWQKGFIVFDNNTLAEKQVQLQRHFGYEFQISKSCNEFRYNAAFDNDSVTELMKVIKEMTPSICYCVDRYTMTVKVWNGND